ncbi:hypothetical protein ACIBI4_33795 [Streptomyces sp. NPDC050418]|uniref:hypothetical protein n=1 Tax=Streptomyces sp. NPDC050418 TaxID=3365612 RepID=UPI0037AA614D
MENAAPPMPEHRPAAEEPPPTPPPGEPSARPKRKRGRTTLLVLCAALIGVAGGTVYGYTVQADRGPTPLPALAQPELGYPAEESKTAKDAAGKHKADGDLRKLLVRKPSGASALSRSVFEGGTLADDSWLSVRDYAREFEEPGEMLLAFNTMGIRRVAAADWRQGTYKMTGIRLVQFQADGQQGAIEHATQQLSYMPLSNRGAGNPGKPFKGSVEGRYFVYPVENKPGYLPAYAVRAIAYRGDVMIDVHIFDTKPIGEAEIRKLIEKQVGRL